MPRALRLDIPVVIAVAVACLPLFFADYRIGQTTGGAFSQPTSPT